MISRTTTRKELHKALVEKQKVGIQYQYPMSKFRHAIMDCADRCKAISSCSWTLDNIKKIVTCIFYFKSTYISCSYDYVTDTVEVNVFKNNIKQSNVNCSCSELSDYIKSFQPKTVMVIKKKEV